MMEVKTAVDWEIDPHVEIETSSEDGGDVVIGILQQRWGGIFLKQRNTIKWFFPGKIRRQTLEDAIGDAVPTIRVRYLNLKPISQQLVITFVCVDRDAAERTRETLKSRWGGKFQLVGNQLDWMKCIKIRRATLESVLDMCFIERIEYKDRV